MNTLELRTGKIAGVIYDWPSHNQSSAYTNRYARSQPVQP